MPSDVTNAALRAAMQTAIEHHLQRRAESPQPPAHASHALLPVVRGSEDSGGACVIEPAVRCNHCGYCRSYGH